MGDPSSGVIVEIFLQNAGNLHLAHQQHRNNITNYFRYVDYIILIFDPKHTDIKEILTDFNVIHPKLHFTAETENNNSLNYMWK